MTTTEGFLRAQTRFVIENLNDDRDESKQIVLTEEEMKDIVNGLLNNDYLWEEIYIQVKNTIEYVIGED